MSRGPVKRGISSDQAPRAAGAYSSAVRAGDLVFVSGQVPIDPETGELVPGSVEARTTRALQNVAALLAAAGAGLDDVVKITAHLESFDMFDDFDRAYRAFFGDALPARTTVASGLGGVEVELDAIAVVSSAAQAQDDG
jgi:2-iminobutanoate/2-iminopropanoate deaminase